jgi:hypothetical protein
VADDLSFIDEELKKRGVDPQQALLSFVQPGSMSRPQLPAAKALQRAPETPAAPEMAQAQTAPSGGMLSFANAAQPAAPAVKVSAAPALSFTKNFQDVEARRKNEQGPEPTREQFPAEKLPVWKKILGALASTAAGVGNPDAAGETARRFFGGPERRAEKKFETARQTWEEKGKTLDQEEAKIKEAASVQDTEAQTNLRNEQAAAAGRKDDEVLAKSGLMRDEQGAIVPMPEDKLPPELRTKMANEKSLRELRESQQRLAAAKLEFEKAKSDPNSPQFKLAQQKLQMEQQRTNATLRALGLHEQEFANKLNEQELVKPSGQTQSRGSAAQVIVDVIPDLKEAVQKNRDQIGPLAGRLARGEITIGDVPPQIAKLFIQMESFNALQPAAHGFRAAEFVKDWKTALGSLERDPDAFIAGLEGLQPTMEKIAKEGKTYHQRIVEGRPSKPAAGDSGKAPVWNAKSGRYE